MGFGEERRGMLRGFSEAWKSIRAWPRIQDRSIVGDVWLI